MDLFSKLFEVFNKSFVSLFKILSISIFFGFILSFIGNKISRNIYLLAGEKGVILFSRIGVPIHEIGHYIFALLFGHSIQDVRLFVPTKTLQSGTVLGYVNHSYNPASFFQTSGNFLIGIAPIFSATIFLSIILKMLVPELYSSLDSLSGTESSYIFILLKKMSALISNLFSLKNFTNVSFYLFVVLAISITSSISLSKADMKGALVGIVSMLSVVFLIGIFFEFSGIGLEKFVNAFTGVNLKLFDFLSITLIFSSFSYFITRVGVFIFYGR